MGRDATDPVTSATRSTRTSERSGTPGSSRTASASSRRSGGGRTGRSSRSWPRLVPRDLARPDEDVVFVALDHHGISEREGGGTRRESEGRVPRTRRVLAEATFALHERRAGRRRRPGRLLGRGPNPAFEAITGIHRRRTIGRTAREVHPEPRALVHRALRAGGDDGRVRPLRGRTSRRRDRGTTIHAYSPGPGRFASVFADVTAQRRAAAESAVRERTRYRNRGRALAGRRDPDPRGRSADRPREPGRRRSGRGRRAGVPHRTTGPRDLSIPKAPGSARR